MRLTGKDEEKLAKRYTKDAEAYELYLKGRYFWNKRGEAGLRNGIKYFQEAEEKDPNYALAYSGLADSYSLLCDIGVVAPVTEMPQAKAAAQKAVDIDPTLAEGYTSRGFRETRLRLGLAGCRSRLEASPRAESEISHSSSVVRVVSGADGKIRSGQSRKLNKRSNSIPSRQSSVRMPGLYSYFEHRYDDAIAQYQKTLEIDPDFWVAHHYLGLAYAKKGMYEEAISELRNSLHSPGSGPLKEGAVENDPEVAASLGFAYASAGRRAEAEAILSRLKALSQRRYVSGLYMAIVYTGLNDKDRAVEYLNKAYDNRHPGLVLIRVDPIFDNLRSDERFKQLIARFEPIP